MRNGLPFSKPKVRLFGDPGEAQQYLGEAYNLLFKVRQFCEQSGVPVFSMQRQLPNGALVTAAIVGAEEIVSALPPANGGPVEVRRGLKKIPYFLANFFGTPSSEDHPAGYVPQHPQHPEAQYPGPVSVWAKYNSDNVPPAPAPKTPEDKNELTPAHPIEEQPGNCTWWSDQIKFRKEAVVLSWKHPLNMQGRYGVITRFKSLIGSGSPVAYRGNYALQRLPGSPYISGGDFSAVWVNGVKIKLLGVSKVFSAALKNEIDPESGEEQVFLCVLTLDGETLNFRKAPFPWSFKELTDEPGAQRQVSLTNVFKKLNDRVLNLQQPPFINASATACLVLCESKMPDGYFYSTDSPYISTSTLVLSEWVFDNDTSDRAANSEYVYTLGPTLNKGRGVVSQNLLDETWFESTSFLERTSSRSRGDIVSKRVDILCADYCGDELVYVSSVIEGVSQGLSSERKIRYRHTFAHKQLSFVQTGPGTADVTTARLYVHEANTSTSLIFGSSSVSAKLVHSKKGELVSEALSYGDSDKFDYAYSGGVNAEWVTFNSDIVSESIQNSGGFEFFLPQVTMVEPDEFPEREYARTSYGYSTTFSVLGGDLRTDILLCEKIHNKSEINHSRTVTNPEGWYTKLEPVTDNNGLRTKGVTSSVLLLDKGRVKELAVSKIREDQSEVLNRYSHVDDNLANTEIMRLNPTNFESSSESSGKSLKIGITCTPINLHYENPREENDPLFRNYELEYLPYSSFSSDTRGDYAYFGFCQPDTWVDPKEINAFKIKNTLHILEPETYAPGNFSTLSEPVFFGKVFDREDNIPDD